LLNTVKIDPYIFELYHFKVGSLFLRLIVITFFNSVMKLPFIHFLLHNCLSEQPWLPFRVYST